MFHKFFLSSVEYGASGASTDAVWNFFILTQVATNGSLYIAIRPYGTIWTDHNAHPAAKAPVRVINHHALRFIVF
jgi:hypothetical protein